METAKGGNPKPPVNPAQSAALGIVQASARRSREKGLSLDQAVDQAVKDLKAQLHSDADIFDRGQITIFVLQVYRQP